MSGSRLVTFATLVLPLMVPIAASTGGGVDPTPVAGDHWRPMQDLDWQMQLLGDLDLDHGRDVVFLDLFDATDDDLAVLHGRGTRTVCYFSAGSYEDWRPGAGDYPADIIGGPLADWPGEWWVDVGSPALRPLIAARLDLAVARNCDGVGPDNVDGFANETGLDLTAADQLAFNRWLADAAHARGLGVGLKNDVGQAATLAEWFDWQVNEQCVQYAECDALAPFIDAGKPVFGLGYPRDDTQSLRDRAAGVCAVALAAGHDTMVKPLDLTPPLMRCADVWHD